MFKAFPKHRVLLAALVIGGLGSLVAVGTTIGSDHQDTPEVELSPRMDINDVYAFPGSSDDRIVLVMTTSSPLTPAQATTASFDPNLLYQLKIDNTGDAIEDLVLQLTFEGMGASQRVRLYGPTRPEMAGPRNTIVADAAQLTGSFNSPFGSASNIQVFAGPRDDPFFLDLEQFFRIIPDRRPVSGPLAQLPDQPSASSFRAPGQAVDYLRGLNTLAIVIELPESLLTVGGTAKLGIWGTISR
ncbi:MAG: DUF4331 family protein [Longimicrobiales bacterium]